MKRLLVSMPEPMRRRLDAESERSGLLLGEMIRAAVDAWLASREMAAKNHPRNEATLAER